jgi:hypothetical protein
VITGNVIKNNRYGITFNGGSNINSLISYNQIDSNNTQNNPSLGGSGIAFSGGSASSHQNSIVTGNVIRWNLWGITIQNGAKPNLGDLGNTDTSDNGKNWFSGNTNSGTPGINLYNNSPDAIMAQGNYWGSNDPSAIEASIFHQPDNASLGLVDYSTYVLPVELLSFTASVTGNAVQLNWKTSTEINSNYFEIEKSDNETTYKKLGAVSAAGTSNSILSYSYTDLTYDPATGAFYRLKIIDKDGRYKYSPVAIIKSKEYGQNLTLFPTLLRMGGQLNLDISVIKDRVVNIYFYDATGKMLGRLSEAVIPGRNQVIIKDIPSIRGNLFVKISCGEFNKTIPLIIQ